MRTTYDTAGTFKVELLLNVRHSTMHLTPVIEVALGQWHFVTIAVDNLDYDFSIENVGATPTHTHSGNILPDKILFTDPVNSIKQYVKEMVIWEGDQSANPLFSGHKCK